jgi:hypothetical protein
LRLALNRLSEKGEWNLDELKIEFEDLILTDAPIEMSGFTLEEIDQIVVSDDAEGVEQGPLAQSLGSSNNILYQILNPVGSRRVGAERILLMTRIVEHRSALPFGTVVEVHVHRGPVGDMPTLATINVTKFSSRPDPDSFVDPLPVADAFLQALAYAERAGIACVWIDDPDGHFPPEKRPVHDVTGS